MIRVSEYQQLQQVYTEALKIRDALIDKSLHIETDQDMRNNMMIVLSHYLLSGVNEENVPRKIVFAQRNVIDADHDLMKATTEQSEGVTK